MLITDQIWSRIPNCYFCLDGVIRIKKEEPVTKLLKKTILEPKGPLHYHLSLFLLYIFDSAAAMKVITGTEYNATTLTAEMGKI